MNYLFGINDIDFQRIPDSFRAKAEFKDIDPGRLKESLNDKKDKYARMWESRLQYQVKDLPNLEETSRELNRDLRKIGLV